MARVRRSNLRFSSIVGRSDRWRNRSYRRDASAGCSWSGDRIIVSLTMSGAKCSMHTSNGAACAGDLTWMLWQDHVSPDEVPRLRCVQFMEAEQEVEWVPAGLGSLTSKAGSRGRRRSLPKAKLLHSRLIGFSHAMTLGYFQHGFFVVQHRCGDYAGFFCQEPFSLEVEQPSPKP